MKKIYKTITETTDIFTVGMFYAATLIILSMWGYSRPGAESLESLPRVVVETAYGNKLDVYVALSGAGQARGLSGVKPEEFGHDQAMLFPAEKDKKRVFWMPNTHFDLDIVFLDENLRVLDIHRGLAHFPGLTPKKEIPKSRGVFCRHVLEIRSDSPLSKEIEIGDQLTFKGPRLLLKESR